MKNPKLISALVLAGVLLVLACFLFLGSVFKTGTQVTVFILASISIAAAATWLRVGKNR
jgi:hypothetical protein